MKSWERVLGGHWLPDLGWPNTTVGVLDRQSLRENVGNRKVGRQRLEQRRQLRARLREEASRLDRRRPGRGDSPPVSQDATVDVKGLRRNRIAVRMLIGLEAVGRYLLIGLLLPLALLPALLRPREFVRRLREAPTRIRSSARRIRISSRDPETAAGRVVEASRLSLHFVREELADMQDGFPSPVVLAETISERIKTGVRLLAMGLGLAPEDRRLGGVGERLFHAAALGLIGGAVVVGIFVASFQGMESLKASDRLTLQDIQVLGLDRLSEGAFLLDLEARFGDNLLELDLERVAANAQEIPWVERVELERNLRDQRLTIKVVEYQPSLLLAGSSLSLVDNQGRVFKKLEQTDPQDFPLLRLDPEIGLASKNRAARGAVEIVHALGASRVLPAAELSEVRYREGEGFTLYTRSGLPIRIGSRDFAERLGRLERAVDSGELPLSAVASVDISLRDRLVVVPRATRQAKRQLLKKVETQRVPKERRSRMLYLERLRKRLDTDGELQL
ncbi:MAG: cell division protein FtsQ/DivIB [Myxococcota bacterium]|nr:cell division protein FtsQ/DivIB [Myxococcota bacterium]